MSAAIVKALTAAAPPDVADWIRDRADRIAKEIAAAEKHGGNRRSVVPFRLLDKMRGHELLSAEAARSLPPIRGQENVEDPIVWVKLFTPYGTGTWYLTEYDPNADVAFGMADLGYPEMGDMWLEEMGEATIKIGRSDLPAIERDLHWTPVRLSVARKRSL